MNHVYVVNNENGVETFEMDDNLSKIISIVRKPVDAELVIHLRRTRNMWSYKDDTVRKYYNHVFQLREIFKPGSSDDRYEIAMTGIKNLSIKWYQDLRLALGLIAKECGEDNIFNLSMYTPDDHIEVRYVGCKEINHTPKSTFTVVNTIGEDSRAELIVCNGWEGGRIELKEGDVIIFRDRDMFEETVVSVFGYVELLTVDYDLEKAQNDKRSEELTKYINGEITPPTFIKGVLEDLEQRPYA